MSKTFAIYRMDMETDECKLIKTLSGVTEKQAKDRVASFKRLTQRLAKIGAKKAAENWEYYCKEIK